MYVYVCMHKLNYFNFSCTFDEKDLSLGFRAFSIYRVSKYSNFFIFFINEHITLIVAFFRTKIFSRSLSRVTKGGDTNIATCPNCGY